MKKEALLILGTDGRKPAKLILGEIDLMKELCVTGVSVHVAADEATEVRLEVDLRFLNVHAVTGRVKVPVEALQILAEMNGFTLAEATEKAA